MSIIVKDRVKALNRLISENTAKSTVPSIPAGVGNPPKIPIRSHASLVLLTAGKLLDKSVGISQLNSEKQRPDICVVRPTPKNFCPSGPEAGPSPGPELSDHSVAVSMVTPNLEPSVDIPVPEFRFSKTEKNPVSFKSKTVKWRRQKDRFVATAKVLVRKLAKFKKEKTSADLTALLQLAEALNDNSLLKQQLQVLRQNNDRLVVAAAEEKGEWKQFEKDLLTTVRVANRFKEEALVQLEEIKLQNQRLIENSPLLCRETELVLDTDTPCNKCVNKSPTNNYVQDLPEPKLNSDTQVSLQSIVPTCETSKVAKQSVVSKPDIPTLPLKDPLSSLMKTERSKRNALLKWCQIKTSNYAQIEITNFSYSWSNGMALCALFDTYLPYSVHYEDLSPNNVHRNFQVAMNAARSAGIKEIFPLEELQSECPDWKLVMNFVMTVYSHFELE